MFDDYYHDLPKGNIEKYINLQMIKCDRTGHYL